MDDVCSVDVLEESYQRLYVSRGEDRAPLQCHQSSQASLWVREGETLDVGYGFNVFLSELI